MKPQNNAKLQELLMKAEANLLRAATSWAESSEEGKVWESGGLVLTSSRVGIRSFNQLFLIHLPVDKTHLEQAISEYKAKGLRFRLRLRRELQQRVTPLLAELGLEQRGGIPCMALVGRSHAAADAPGLKVVRVLNQETLSDHVSVVADAFDWLPSDLAQVFRPSLLQVPGWSGWVGYTAGVPAAASQLMVNDTVAGIYYVATSERFRRRGFGETLTLTALESALSQGCDMVSLQASPNGYPIYKRMGFVDIGEYVTYVLAPSFRGAPASA